MQMPKSSKKSQYKYNQAAINTLSKKYGLTKNYIREIVNGNRQAEISDQLIREYKAIARDVQEITNKHMKL